MPSTILRDLDTAATILTNRGLWTGDNAFGADREGGPLDPVAALWLAAHNTLPYLFTIQMPGAAQMAAEMVRTDPRVLAAVEFLSANLTDDETAITDDDPIERIADWIINTPEVEVIGRLVRLAEPATELAA